MDKYQQSLRFHKKLKGKLSVQSKVKIEDSETLSLAYTPGVAQPCREIKNRPESVYTYTGKGNLVAVISDGSAVLGLGNIGALASLPVMEGKAMLFKEFADIDSVPVILDTQDTDEIVRTIINIAPTYGGINLEDISAPRCFEIEKRLKEALDIPVFHDDQHGTAIVVLAALINALKVVGKTKENVKIVLNGPGAAGTAITKLLYLYGCKNIVIHDKDGILYKGKTGLDYAKTELAEFTNVNGLQGGLKTAMMGADVFIGVSVPDCVTANMVSDMAKNPIMFTLANPQPEIMPDIARAAGAKVIGTGRSDFPNQINNVLVFPGIFRGALDARVNAITDEMKLAAATAIASLVTDSELNPEYIIPKVFDKRVAPVVAEAVKKASV